MNDKLRHLLLEAPRITGDYGELSLAYMQEHLTLSEYEKVKRFFAWLTENNLAYGWGTLDLRWRECFQK